MKRIVALAILIGVPAHAANWKLVETGEHGLDVAVDTHSIEKIAPGLRAASFKFIYAHADDDGVLQYIVHDRLDCAARSIATLSRTNYDAAGKMLSTKTMPAPKFEPAANDIHEEMLDAVCLG